MTLLITNAFATSIGNGMAIVAHIVAMLHSLQLTLRNIIG